MKLVDLEVCEGVLFENDPSHRAVVLPGAFYVPAAPLLWFASQVLQAAGWTVLQVWDRRRDASDPVRWAEDRLDAALRHFDTTGGTLVIAKSITSLTASAVAARHLPAIWLTPLLNHPIVREGLVAGSAPRLLAGGTADPTWDADFAAQLDEATVVEVPGADHAIQFPGGDHRASLDALGTVTDAVADFVAGLA